MFVRAVLVAAAIAVVGVGVAPIAGADGPYRNCTDAHKDGRWDIPQGDPDYWPGGPGPRRHRLRVMSVRPAYRPGDGVDNVT
jgi:hypothetical protein